MRRHLQDDDPMVADEATRQSELNNMLNSLSNTQLLAQDDAGGDPLAEEDKAQRDAVNDLVNSLVDKSSADALLALAATATVDKNEIERKMDALNDYIDVGQRQLVAQEDVGDDPLADEDKAKRDALNDLVNSLANKGSDAPTAEGNGDELLATTSARQLISEFGARHRTLEADATARRHANARRGFMAAEDTRRRRTLEAKYAKDRQLGATGVAVRRRALEAVAAQRLRSLGADDSQRRRLGADRHRLVADGRHRLEADETARRRRLEADEADRHHRLEANGRHRLEADDTTAWHRALEAHGHESLNRHRSLAATSEQAATAALDIPQLLSGAVLLVAVVALVTLVRRRRAQPRAITKDDDYQLFM